MIDLGLVKKFIDPKTGRHFANKSVRTLTGTARYASLNSHENEQSRRDDLEAIGLTMIYFLKGSLPWQGIKLDTNDDKKKNNAIFNCKKETSLETLCELCPEEFYKYLDYCRNQLPFNKKPDYDYLRSLMK